MGKLNLSHCRNSFSGFAENLSYWALLPMAGEQNNQYSEGWVRWWLAKSHICFVELEAPCIASA